MNAHIIIKKVNKQLQIINTFANPKISITKWEDSVLGKLHIHKKQVKFRRGTWISWKNPPSGENKLNVDGGYKNGVGYVGGILRCEDGTPILAFWRKVQVEDAEEAEIEAINRGIDNCNAIGISNFTIETDSSAWLRAFNGKVNSSRKIYKTRKYSQFATKITQIYREGNQAADLLAKMARSSPDAVVLNYSNLPNKVKLRIYHDRIGMPTYRKKWT
ncbi:hypothetical protein CASFOL_009166 [Castilleja foliolosa]|uniref:RNase H type-1 domain-containing protein n=1 Tax=Castilleja foliolosa TaxID=1961234 RepID=A0ABD3DYM7_9LAMI